MHDSDKVASVSVRASGLFLENVMRTAVLKDDLMRADGATFRMGTRFCVLREYLVNRQTQTCYALGREDGTILLPCVDPEHIDIEARSP